MRDHEFPTDCWFPAGRPDDPPQAPNRAARRARGGRRPDTPPGSGKVRGGGPAHAPDPRRWAAHRKG